MDNTEIELEARGFTPEAINTYKYYNRKFLEIFGKRLREADKRDVMNYLSYLKRLGYCNTSLASTILSSASINEI